MIMERMQRKDSIMADKEKKKEAREELQEMTRQAKAD